MAYDHDSQQRDKRTYNPYYHREGLDPFKFLFERHHIFLISGFIIDIFLSIGGNCGLLSHFVSTRISPELFFDARVHNTGRGIHGNGYPATQKIGSMFGSADNRNVKA